MDLGPTLTVSLSSSKLELLLHTTDRTVVRVPADASGMACLKHILQHRESMGRAVISTPSAPTQRQVDEMLKLFIASGNVVKRAAINAPADLSLEDLDLA